MYIKKYFFLTEDLKLLYRKLSSKLNWMDIIFFYRKSFRYNKFQSINNIPQKKNSSYTYILNCFSILMMMRCEFLYHILFSPNTKRDELPIQCLIARTHTHTHMAAVSSSKQTSHNRFIPINSTFRLYIYKYIHRGFTHTYAQNVRAQINEEL